jgi:Ca2+-binding EF-hand superfamily protein
MNATRRLPVLAGVVFAAVISFSPAAVTAQEDAAGEDGSRFIQHFDQDGDGLVSAEEFPGGENRFNRLDANGDGTIDQTEAPQRPHRSRAHAKARLAEWDADGSGDISAEEFPGPLDHFDRMDSDGDGFLSIEELRAGMPGPPRGAGFAGDDADLDGMVSLDEFSGTEEWFDHLDADGDGYLTRDEVRQMHPDGGPEQIDEARED